MSKGLGKIQRVVCDLLSGDRAGQVYKTASSGLDTRELLDELLEAGFISAEMPRKQQMATVLRACGGLARRELIRGKYVSDLNNTGRTTVQWTIKRGDRPKLPP